MTIRAAGATDVGCQRVVNEDRFMSDPARGIFAVIDGVGGQNAGGRAADTALDVIRTRLADLRTVGPSNARPSGNGLVAVRMREAITAANNEVHREAESRPELKGMACVLTAVVIDGNHAIVGHVGDTRLYKLRGGGIQKITPDHSPVGEREDAGEISEIDAMRHPRRNEVFRDVGSEAHDVNDSDFVDVRDTPMEPDTALLLCSDGLSDLVSSDEIRNIVQQHAGRPEEVTRALVKAANDAGGKDNVTVVYVEGERFGTGTARPAQQPRKRRPALVIALVVLALAATAWAWSGYPIPDVIAQALIAEPANVIVVRPGESISDAVARAAAGATVMVEPGEYRERLTLKGNVRVISKVSRAATIRLPGDATDQDAAVVAVDAAYAELSGFRIVGDAASALGTGVMARSSNVRLIDLEVTGAARTAIDLGPGDDVMLLASDIHDNPGAGLALRAEACPRITHNTFSSNGVSEQATAAVVIETGARAIFELNTFRNLEPGSFAALDPASRTQLTNVNWFPDFRGTSATSGSSAPSGSRGRGTPATPRPGRSGR